MTAGAIAVPMIFPLRPPTAGKSKNSIDSNTLIELSCATNGAVVYYTTNGTKPDPFQPLGSGQRHTLKYKNPFTLLAGKQTVKAIAISQDGVRESHVVSKTFEVMGVESEKPNSELDNDIHFQDDMALGNFNPRKHAKNLVKKLLAENEAWTENRSDKHKIYPGTRNFDKRKPLSASNKSTIGSSISDDLFAKTASDIDPYDKKKKIPDNAAQVLRFQRESDFMKCVFCFSPRPADPYARFCNVCGNPVPPVPQTRMPPPEPGQTGLCVHCKSMVPFNLPSCVICEAPLPPQNVPKASIQLAKKLLCTICGTQNPADLKACITCEAKLPANQGPVYPVVAGAPPPNKTAKMIFCSKCGRVNDPNARFCDWCGAKPSIPVTNMTCPKCSASNQPYAKFCGTCATMLEPPLRDDPRCSHVSMNVYTAGGTKLDPQWMPVSMPLPHQVRKPTRTMATQTVGLTYPSERELAKKQAEQEDKMSFDKVQKDRRPLLTAVSPGRGYWRKQLDHVCAHLRAHAQNDSDFRALVGEPKMGKLVSATVQEDGYETSITANFILRGNKDPYTGKPLHLGRGDFLSSLTEGGDRSPTDTYRSEVSSVTSQRIGGAGKTKKKKKVVKKAPTKDDKLSEKDKTLLKEVGKNGEGRPQEIEQLVDEGANVNCQNRDGFTPLFVAVLNKHVDAIPVLVQNKAELNKKGPQRGNTVLHEAILMGPAASEVVSTLLGCGVKQNIKNDKGETAYELAVKNKHDSLAERLATYGAQSKLDLLMKTKSDNGIIDI